jgi:hypothetical protein
MKYTVATKREDWKGKGGVRRGRLVSNWNGF